MLAGFTRLKNHGFAVAGTMAEPTDDTSDGGLDHADPACASIRREFNGGINPSPNG